MFLTLPQSCHITIILCILVDYFHMRVCQLSSKYVLYKLHKLGMDVEVVYSSCSRCFGDTLALMVQLFFLRILMVQPRSEYCFSIFVSCGMYNVNVVSAEGKKKVLLWLLRSSSESYNAWQFFPIFPLIFLMIFCYATIT